MSKKSLNNNLSDTNVAINVSHLFGVYNENKENEYVSLTDINFSFKKNKIYYLIGNSGSGKSTLVNHFNGLLKSKYGSVIINNEFKIGDDFFINKYVLGVLNKNNIHIEEYFPNINQIKNKYNKFCSYIFVLKNNLPKHLVKILFEGYYKVNSSKIVKLKSIFNHLSFYLVIVDPNQNENNIDVYSNLNISSLKKIKESKDSIFKIYWKYFFYKKKIKHIKKLRKMVGIVFQFPEYQLFKDTVEKDVMFGPLILGDSKEVAKEKAKKYLLKLGLPEQYLYNSPFELSGGQKRRVAIAGILAIEPNILIFDEPTAGLDPVGEQEILKLIKQAKTNDQTIIVISHNMDHVLELADEVIVMNDGEIIAFGDPYKIFTNKELLIKSNLDLPMIIDLINQLANENEIFSKLYDLKPRNINELANYLSKILESNV